MTPTTIGVLALFGLLILFKKGYIGHPFKSKSRRVEETGLAFLAAVKSEVEIEDAKRLVEKTKEDVRSRLQGPFVAEAATETK